MARQNGERQILLTLATDPRLRSLSDAARLLWIDLIAAMQIAGVFALPFADRVAAAKACAKIAAMEDANVAAHLDALVAVGMLRWEADGALSSPLLAARAARSEINRANALRGAEKRRARPPAGQREMPLMQTVAGTEHAAAGNSVSDSVSELAANGAPDTDVAIANKLEAKLRPKLAVSDADFHAAGRAAVEAAGFDPATWGGNYGIVRQWLADGLVLAEIVAVIRALMAKGRRPSHLGFFGKAMAEAVARKVAGQQPAMEVVSDWREDPCSVRWMAALEDWRFGGKIGPMPQPQEFRPGGRHHQPIEAAA